MNGFVLLRSNQDAFQQDILRIMILHYGPEQKNGSVVIKWKIENLMKSQNNNIQILWNCGKKNPYTCLEINRALVTEKTGKANSAWKRRHGKESFLSDHLWEISLQWGALKLHKPFNLNISFYTASKVKKWYMKKKRFKKAKDETNSIRIGAFV